MDFTLNIVLRLFRLVEFCNLRWNASSDGSWKYTMAKVLMKKIMQTMIDFTGNAIIFPL